MKYTENYGFDKPEGTDFVDVEHFNTNAELLDKLLCPEYSEAEELTELKNGEKLSVAFAKIAKIVKEFISHIKDKISHLTEEEHKELTGLIRLDITGETVDVDKYTLSGGTPKIMRIISKTNGGSSNITNIPVAGFPFIMDIELIRWASVTDYITRQKFVNANNPENEYVRYCTNGVWGAWVTRVFTDTKTSIAANLTTTTTGYALDATMGKKLQDNKVDKVSGMGLSTNDYTNAEKTKLAGIATGANKTTVDSAMSSSSTNPLQNKIITAQTNSLFYLAAKALENSTLVKSVSSCYISGELGNVYYGYMDVNDCKNNLGKEVIIYYSNGAIRKGKITNASGYYSLEAGKPTWLYSSVPYVNKNTIQAGTKTLPNAGTTDYGYVLSTTYGAVLEISNANNFATKYLILP